MPRLWDKLLERDRAYFDKQGTNGLFGEQGTDGLQGRFTRTAQAFVDRPYDSFGDHWGAKIEDNGDLSVWSRYQDESDRMYRYRQLPDGHVVIVGTAPDVHGQRHESAEVLELNDAQLEGELEFLDDVLASQDNRRLAGHIGHALGVSRQVNALKETVDSWPTFWGKN